MDDTLDPHLAAERAPVEQHRRPRVLGDLLALAAEVVRVEDESALVEALQEHHPRGGRAARRRGGKHDRLGRRHGVGSLGVPGGELAQRIGVEVGSPQRCAAHTAFCTLPPFRQRVQT